MQPSDGPDRELAPDGAASHATSGSSVERIVAAGQLVALEGFDDVVVLRLPMQRYLDMLEAGEPFAFVKRTHGFWDRLADLPEVLPDLDAVMDDAAARWGQPVTDASDPRAQLAQLLVERRLPDEAIQALEARRTFRGIWETGAMADLIAALQSPHASHRYLESVAFRGYPNSDHHPAHHDVALLRRAYHVFHTSGRLPHDALLFKQAAIDGSLREFWALLARLGRPTVLVGPPHLADLSTRCGFADLLHAPIHGTRAFYLRSDILASLRELLRSFPPDSRPILLFQAASLTDWLIHRLFGEFPDVTLIDVGRSVDAYYPEVVAPQNWFQINRDAIIDRLGIADLHT